MEKLRRYINRIKAVKHGMDPTAKIEDIREFESRYNIDIPESYVDFLTRVGNGGEFPGLILFPLDRVEAESALWLCRKSEAVFLDKPDISADFPELCGQAEANGEERYDEILSAILNGALVIGTTGCTVLAVLMCMGSNRGTIGLVDTDLSDGFEPRLLNIKEPLIKSRLTAWRISCLHIFRHLAQFVLARRQPCVVLIVQSGEKSDCAIYAPDLISVSLILMNGYRNISAGGKLLKYAEKSGIIKS